MDDAYIEFLHADILKIDMAKTINEFEHPFSGCGGGGYAKLFFKIILQPSKPLIASNLLSSSQHLFPMNHVCLCELRKLISTLRGFLNLCKKLLIETQRVRLKSTFEFPFLKKVFYQ